MDTTNTKDVHIDVHHVTRVEGHGNIVVDMKNGELEKCELQIVEAPRFFEAMLRGQPYQHAAHITCRICGICSVSHTTVSLRAAEKALGVQLSEQTEWLRKVIFNAEMLDSHILHVYMLVAPDLLGAGSVIPLAESAPDVVMRALRMKKLAGDICAAIGGRHTHPVAMTIGGFTHYPIEETLIALCERLEAMRADLDATVELFQSLKLPDFERDTEFIALQKEDEYCFIDGVIASSDGGTWPIEEYRDVTNEFLVDHSTAKRTRNKRDSYMVGALARFNINYDLLHPRAKAAATALGLKPKCINPYMNSVAQVVEIVHSTEESIEITQRLLEHGITQEEPAKPTRMTGEGIGGVEAPRGILFHNYVIEEGVVTGANCVIPTNQNLENCELDMRSLVPQYIDRSPEEIRFALEMLVRAYDPCISCSTHMLDVKFV
jgi:sulfhydrogenase subunit alpha